MTFSFTPESLHLAKNAIAKYPDGKKQSAVMELLWIAQRQNSNWVPKEAIECIAQMLEMPNARVFEIVTFYSMYNLKPVGKHYIQACGTTPCMLMGSENLMQTIYEELGIKSGQSTVDGLFTLLEVECLGACSNGPMVQINDDYYEDLTPATMKQIINALKKGEKVKIGSQAGRKSSETKELV